MISNVTVEKLEKKHGKEEGFRRFAEIAKLGGFGEPTRDHTGGIDPAYRGGLDLKGLRNVEGDDRLSDAALAKIEELASGVEEETVKADAKKGKEK